MSEELVWTPGVPQTGVGIVAPDDLALDRELWRWAPADVTLHITRMASVAMPVTIAMAEAVSEPGPLRDAVRTLAPVAPHCVGYACTSGSFVRGVAGEREMRSVMCDAGATRATTVSGALLRAMELLDVHRLAVVTPYLEDVTHRLHGFLAEAGHEVVSSTHLGLTRDIWLVPYETVVDATLRAMSADADAVFISCTNLATYDVIEPLTARLGVPVLSANELLMWETLEACGKRIVGPGADRLP